MPDPPRRTEVTQRPARVYCSYVTKDAAYFATLRQHLQPLEEQGLIEILDGKLGPGHYAQHNMDGFARADVVIVLVSRNYLASKKGPQELAQIRKYHDEGSLVAVPVLLNPVTPGPALEGLDLVPQGGAVFSELTRTAQEDAMAEVVRRVRASPRRPEPAASAPRRILRLADIFQLVGQPTSTYVEPRQLPDLVERLQYAGEGLVVEGPSGVGKTTAVKKALAQIGRGSSSEWLQGTEPQCLHRLDALLAAGLPEGYLIVDDFHHLDSARQNGLARLMKAIADRDRRNAKIVVIGVNRVGTSLVQDLPDVAGRFEVVSMGRQPDEKIEHLISLGEQAANVVFVHRSNLIEAARGSFAIAQTLCREAARRAGIFQTAPRRTEIGITLAEIRDSVHQNLGYRFRPYLIDFAAWDESPPPRGACLLLLWHLSRAQEDSVLVQEVRNQATAVHPVMAPAFAWLMASNLAKHFEENPQLSRLLHFNRSAAVLSTEDPQLRFYLQYLDWADFARASGHELLGWDPQRGPLFVSPRAATGPASAPEAAVPV